MRQAAKSDFWAWFDDTLLFLSVHLDGFRYDPATYLLGVWWRMVGKRLRGRSLICRVLGHSPRAYDYWYRTNPRALQTAEHSQIPPAITALVDIRMARASLDATLHSLDAESIPIVIIGSDATPDLAAAADQVEWDHRPWLMPIAAGDCVAVGAAARYSELIGESTASLIYADDDLIDAKGRRHSPHFKPDWNSELFRHFDYVTGASIIRASRDELLAVSGDPDWPAKLVARSIEQRLPDHLKFMAHHRQARPCPVVPARYDIIADKLPTATVIVPTRNRRDLLETCIAGLAGTNYPDFDVIIVDNDSDDPATLAFLASLQPPRFRVLHHPGPFNYSAINNRAVSEARGELICLLNNDIEIIDPDWLAALAHQAVRDDVGAVGARLLYPDGRVQHAGVAIGMGNAAGHAHRLLWPSEKGYFQRHNLPQFTSAVTAACLVVMRERFLAVGGLDETNFAVAFNDVDLCLRLNQRGWQSLYEPRATLIHHESVSRGFDRDEVGAARLSREIAALQRLWKTDHVVDPFHHPALSRETELFTLQI